VEGQTFMSARVLVVNLCAGVIMLDSSSPTYLEIKKLKVKGSFEPTAAENHQKRPNLPRALSEPAATSWPEKTW